jgi:hypothetical protein
MAFMNEQSFMKAMKVEARSKQERQTEERRFSAIVRH